MSREVPEGWSSVTLSKIANITLGQSPKTEETNDQGIGLPFFQGNADFGNLHPKPRRWAENGPKIANQGDILISVRAPVGELNTASQLCYIGRGLGAIRATNVEDQFLFYALRFSMPQLHSVSQGSTFDAVNRGDLSKITIILPSLHEQRRIAEILSSVDNAITATQAVVEQTKKVKQATLERLLTKGIGHTRFKQTEIGEIPESWSVAKIEDISSFVTSGSRGWAAYYAEQGSAFIRITNLSRDNIRMNLGEIQRVKIPEGSTEGARTRLKIGDILISITADLGVIGLVSDTNLGEAYVNQHIALVRPLERDVSSSFLAYALSSSVSQKRFQQMNDAGAKAGLNLTTIRSFPLTLPPLEEQIQIAEKATSIDRVIESNKIRVNDLKALKSALMSDLLTGRKRVTDTLPLAAE